MSGRLTDAELEATVCLLRETDPLSRPREPERRRPVTDEELAGLVALGEELAAERVRRDRALLERAERERPYPLAPDPPEVWAARRRLWPDAGELFRAIVLSPDVEVAEALLCGESVPLDRLDAEWVERFGRRS